MQFRNKKGVT